MTPRSARRMLVLALVAVVSAVTAVATALSYRAGHREADELFDAKLAHSARVLSALVDSSLADDLPAPGESLVIRVWHGEATGVGDALVSIDGHAYETKLAFQVSDDRGNLLLRSDSGPDLRLAPLVAGFADVRLDDDGWRVFTLRSPHGLWVQAGERDDIRDELATDIARGTMAPMLFALPLLALLVWLVVAWAGRGLARVSAQIEQRAADSLQPLSATAVPQELRGLVGAIDGLLARLREALARERRFTADAAHELRTPLAALRVHAANLRGAADANERAQSQRRLEDGIARMERLVAQLLELERQDPGGGVAQRRAPLDLVACVRREVAELGVAGLDRGIRIALTGVDRAPLDGEALGLSVLVRNLVDNALRYTPSGGEVAVAVEDLGDAWLLRVDDSGPGIPADERELALARFHRGLGHDVSGSGLGLSIVQRVVERHGGTLQLDDSPLGGLRVQVRLPRPPAPTRG
jgi:two-component system sensor histidine kinase QseC